MLEHQVVLPVYFYTLVKKNLMASIEKIKNILAVTFAKPVAL